MTGRRNIPDEPCIIASPRRGTGAKKRLRRTKLNARDMPRQQRAVTLISPSFFASEGIDLIHAIEPASVILAQVLQEAEAALARFFSTAV